LGAATGDRSVVRCDFGLVDSFRHLADDSLQAEPLPEPGEVAAWLQRIDAFRAEVALLIASPPADQRLIRGSELRR
jgi:hypothetical protein